MDQALLISYVTNSLIELDNKISKSEKNTVKLFSYIYNNINSIDEKVNTVSSYVYPMKDEQLLYTTKLEAALAKNDILIEQIKVCNSALSKKDTEIVELSKQVKELQNYINNAEILSKEYIVLKKSSGLLKFIDSISTFFYTIFHYRKIKEAEALAEQKRIEEEKLCEQKRLEEEALKKQREADARKRTQQKQIAARNQIKNILDNIK